MLVKDIPRDRLAYYCAKAQGWELDADNDWHMLNHEYVSLNDYDPLTNGQQVYDLIELFSYCEIEKDPDTLEISVHVVKDWSDDYFGKGADLAEAVCRAFIASHYGEEVEIR